MSNQPITGTAGSGAFAEAFTGEGDYAPGKMRLTMRFGSQAIKHMIVGKTLYQRLPGASAWQKREVAFDVSPTPTLQATDPRGLSRFPSASTPSKTT